jgi:hypothetical protein
LLKGYSACWGFGRGRNFILPLAGKQKSHFCIGRQLLWPVDDNYFGRFPLSLAACSIFPKRALDGGHQATGQSIHE